MNLNKQEIEGIKAFIAKRGFKYLDVQMEILDHVASVVEEKMTEDSELSFDVALTQAHASFGVFGFSTVEDSVVSAMGKKYSKVFWRNALAFFNIKYIFLVFFGGFLLYQLQTLLGEKLVLTTLWLSVVILIVVFVVFVLRFKAYNKLLVYRTSLIYLIFIGTFLQAFSFIIQNTSDVLIWGVNRSFVLESFLLTVFILYVISAIRTAMVGVRESELLMEKYSSIED